MLSVCCRVAGPPVPVEAADDRSLSEPPAIAVDGQKVLVDGLEAGNTSTTDNGPLRCATAMPVEGAWYTVTVSDAPTRALLSLIGEVGPISEGY